MGQACVKVRWRLLCPCLNSSRVGPAESGMRKRRSSSESAWTTSIISLARSSVNILAAIAAGRYKVPLNPREALLISAAWNKIRPHLAEIGGKTFARMFERSPAVRGAFEKFRVLEGEEERNRLALTLETHGLVVLNAVDEVMMNLDDETACIDLLLEQGRTHARFDDLTEDFFYAIEEPFLFYVVTENTSSQVTALYDKMIKFIIKLLIAGFKQSKKEKLNMIKQSRLARNSTSSRGPSSPSPSSRSRNASVYQPKENNDNNVDTNTLTIPTSLQKSDSLGLK